MKQTENVFFELLRGFQFHKCQLIGSGVIHEMENIIRDYYGKKYVVTFPNATTAIWALIFALNIKKRVVVSSAFGWAGAITPFLEMDNSLVFSNVDSSLNIDSTDKAWVKTDFDTVFSIDYGGIPADTKKLREITKEKGAFLISDSSQSFGAYRDGKPSGYWADAIILSFNSSKAINCLEGGAVVTDDNDLFEQLLRSSQHPYRQKVQLATRHFNEFLPINGRINPVSAFLFNNTFESQIELLKERQNHFFNLYLDLVNMGLVTQIPILSGPTSSTFAEFVMESQGNSSQFIDNLNNQYDLFRFSTIQLCPFSERNGFYKDSIHIPIQKEIPKESLTRLKAVFQSL
jgi:dTDP-4-amino-4,6-dideoxygalactose transaminase